MEQNIGHYAILAVAAKIKTIVITIQADIPKQFSFETIFSLFLLLKNIS